MTQPIAERSPEDLPPPGDARRSVLKQRTDKLEQEAEERAESTERVRIDPKKFEVENEIAQHFNDMEVTNRLPEYDYSWVFTGLNGIKIREKISMLPRGWHVVQGDDPECIELKGIGADTTRRVGDTILMRIQKDRHLILKQRNINLRKAQQEGVTAGLREAGDKYRKHGIIVHTGEDVSDETFKIMQKRAQARGIAGKQFNDAIRTGTVPGAEID